MPQPSDLTASPTLPPAIDATTLLVAAVIVHDRAADRVVLLQRGSNAKFGHDLWDIPVGKSDPGETITETAVRELREETGLVVNSAALRLVHVIHGSRGVVAPNGFLTVVFAATEWSGKLVNGEPAKHSQVRWCEVDAIPTEFVSSTASALSGYLTGGGQVSLDGW